MSDLIDEYNIVYI